MLICWEKCNAWPAQTSQCLGVLIVGSTEQHSKHLPLGTDSLLGEKLGEEAAVKAAARILMLPPQHVGFSPHHRAFPGVLTLHNNIMVDYLTDLLKSAFDSGLRKCLIINAHGGNQTALQAVVNRLGAEFGHEAYVVRYWDLIADAIADIRKSPFGGMGHAGELETSLMLHYYPELVLTDRIGEYPPAEGDEWHHPDMFAKNKIYRYVPFDVYSKDGNVGQPQFGSAEEGALLASLITDRLAALMDHLAEGLE